METLLGLILFVFGVLQIILFFKIWGMTNDVKRMTYYTERILDVCVNNKELGTNIECNNNDVIKGFKVGDLVVDKNDIQWRVVEINDSNIKCKNSTKGVVEYDKDELKLF